MKYRGAWVAQSVKCLTWAQVMILWSVSSSPSLGLETAQSLEPASDSLSLSLSLSVKPCQYCLRLGSLTLHFQCRFIETYLQFLLFSLSSWVNVCTVQLSPSVSYFSSFPPLPPSFLSCIQQFRMWPRISFLKFLFYFYMEREIQRK